MLVQDRTFIGLFNQNAGRAMMIGKNNFDALFGEFGPFKRVTFEFSRLRLVLYSVLFSVLRFLVCFLAPHPQGDSLLIS